MRETPTVAEGEGVSWDMRRAKKGYRNASPVVWICFFVSTFPPPADHLWAVDLAWVFSYYLSYENGRKRITYTLVRGMGLFWSETTDGYSIPGDWIETA
jgi:hypothetical protein